MNREQIDELYSKGPVRRGLIYCSPWCGHGCKITEYDAAGIKAKALAERLGPAWEPEVWENLGWHYAAVTSTGFRMMEYDDRKTLFKDGLGTLHYSLTTNTKYSGSGDTPEEVIKEVLWQIKEDRENLDRMYRDGVAALKKEQ